MTQWYFKICKIVGDWWHIPHLPESLSCFLCLSCYGEYIDIIFLLNPLIGSICACFYTMIITHWLQALIAVFLFCKEVDPLSQGFFQDLVFFSSFFLHYSSYKNLVYAFWLSPLFYLDLRSRYCSKACFENIESLAIKVSSLRHVVSTTRHFFPPHFISPGHS